MNNKLRNIYIDVMKGLLITLVVIGHLPFFDYDSRTLTLIYSFHMHAFLIIGGILSHITVKTKFSSIIIKRLKSTLLPYFIFYIISIIFIPTPSMEQKWKAVIVMFRGIGDPVNALNLPLWFLTFYFVAMTLFEIIEWFSYRVMHMVFDDSDKNQHAIFVSVISLIIIAFVMTISYLYARYYKLPRIPFNVEIAGFCLGFIFIGKVLGKCIPLVYSEIKKSAAITALTILLTIMLLVIFISAWYILSMYNGRIDLNARDYKNAFIMYVDAVLGFFIFAFFAYIISKIPLIKNIFSVFGENSLYILAYHIPSVFISSVFFIPYLPPIVGTTLAHNSLYSIIVLTSFGILFSLILALIHKSINFRA